VQLQKIHTPFFGLLISCSNDQVKYAKAENAFDAGREFIDGTRRISSKNQPITC
jgi:hypothetical protein